MSMQSSALSEEIIKRLKACESFIEDSAVHGFPTEPHRLQCDFLELLAERLAQDGTLSEYDVYREYDLFADAHELMPLPDVERVESHEDEHRFRRMNDFFAHDSVTGRVVLHASHLQDTDVTYDVCQVMDACLNAISERFQQTPEQSTESISLMQTSEDELRHQINEEAVSENAEQDIVERQEEAFESGTPYEEATLAHAASPQSGYDNEEGMSTVTAIVIGVLSAGFLLGLITIYLLYT